MMSHHSVPLLSTTLQKLTGSRTWLRRVKTPRWKAKHVTLTANAVLRHEPSGHPHLPATALLVVPGGARCATHTEQLRHERRHIFVVTAVSSSAAGDRDASRHILFFAAQDGAEVDIWVETLNEVSFARLGVQEKHPFVRPLLHAWGHVLRLRVKDVVDVGREMNYKLSEDALQEVWGEVFTAGMPQELSPDQFVSVMTHVAVKGAVKNTISTASAAPLTGHLNLQQLAHVLARTRDDVAAMLSSHKVDKCSPGLLLHFLFHSSNSLIDPRKAASRHDMTQPLNRYLISSSHNTYLKGDQLKSDSTAEMYRVVLEKGCRCVEIDVWDGDAGEPIVRHGHTMTSSETLMNVLRTIKEHAFSHGNAYPVILSIENHLGRLQQAAASKMIKEVIGDLLFAPGPEQMHVDVLPSPESLRGKIIIKAKTGMPIFRPDYSDAVSEAARTKAASYCEDDDSDDPEDSQQESKSGSGSKDGGKNPSESDSKVISEFAELIFLAGGNRKALVSLWKQGISGKDRYLAASCVSINENKLCDVYESNCMAAIREYNSQSLTRVYPKGTRVDSSNYCPLLGHFLGCQIVALNWQNNDSGLAVNQARFLSNDGCGYVLPPKVSDPEPGTLEIQILSAFLLPSPGKSTDRDIIDPYCMLKVYDTVFDDEGDCCSFNFSTKVAKSNGFAPSWQETAAIPIVNREFAVVIFKIYDRDRTSGDDLIGYIAVPISLLQTGVRSLPLNTKDGTPLALPGTSQRPSVLVRIRWK